VTVASVRMPGDLRTARVYVSVLGEPESLERVLEILQERAFEIQRYIGAELKMRYCPKLTFERDHTTEQVLKVEKILAEIAKNKTIPEDGTKN
jgi:ribosome-binding factor A